MSRRDKGKRIKGKDSGGKRQERRDKKPSKKHVVQGELLTRRNTVLESLRAKRRKFKTLYVQDGLAEKQLKSILHAARQASVNIETVDKNRLGNLAGAGDHQGVALEVGEYPY